MTPRLHAVKARLSDTRGAGSQGGAHLDGHSSRPGRRPASPAAVPARPGEVFEGRMRLVPPVSAVLRSRAGKDDSPPGRIVVRGQLPADSHRNHRLARAISDAAWSEFRRMLEYKAQWYGREVIAVDRWFPSSRLRPACNTLQDRMPLNVRTWTCACATAHDRDVNAAHNLLPAGPAVTVCGAGARPQRSTPDRQSATKQKLSRREP